MSILCGGLTNCLSAARARASTPCACVVQLDMGPQRACIMSANRRATATACDDTETCWKEMGVGMTQISMCAGGWQAWHALSTHKEALGLLLPRCAHGALSVDPHSLPAAGQQAASLQGTGGFAREVSRLAGPAQLHEQDGVVVVDLGGRGQRQRPIPRFRLLRNLRREGAAARLLLASRGDRAQSC